jgi:putative ABC transport system substrate-binding protein
MKRREFIALLGGAATWPVVASAQKAALPVVAVLSGSDDRFPAFTNGIAEAGYHDSRNVSIEFHSVRREGALSHVPGAGRVPQVGHTRAPSAGRRVIRTHPQP